MERAGAQLLPGELPPGVRYAFGKRLPLLAVLLAFPLATAPWYGANLALNRDAIHGWRAAHEAADAITSSVKLRV